jgi:sterol desaturase/sphingolipid hydroxylase (fatty acid hydroxylase superfamily)
VSEALLAHEPLVRLSVFAVVLAAMVLAESLWPARPRHFPRARRWPANLALVIAGTAMLRFVFPLLAVGAAVWAEAHGTGLFHWLALPYWASFLASLLLLDVLIYAQHWAMHLVPILWRLHRVHHTDRDVDATTALRFHPGEIALSMGLKMAAVIALGAPPAAVILFEVVLNAMAMFNHANWKLPRGIERALRLFVVTPDMHRIHHSLKRDETDTNYGFNLSWWDRLFGTYRAAASAPDFPLGLEHFQDASPNGIGFVSFLPFRGGPAR